MARTALVVGAPTDYGANRRGVDMGPSAIRYAGLTDQLERAGIRCEDLGNIDVATPATQQQLDHDDPLAPTREVCMTLQDRLSTSELDVVPIVLGGDHSITLGSLHAVASDATIGVIWFDAHGDFNTPETSPSGNVHGMTLAAALGVGSFRAHPWARVRNLRAENVVLVGTRDVDPGEADALRESGVKVFTMATIDRDGIASVCNAAIERALSGVDAVYVSVDLDFLDPLEAPGVGTPVRGGVTYREAHFAMERVGAELWHRDRLAGLDLVEVNPIRDRVNETASLATELAASACGKQIL